MPIPRFEFSPSDEELSSFVADNALLSAELGELRGVLAEIAAMDEEDRKRWKTPEDILAEFHHRVREVYKFPPLSREQIEDNFTAENLLNLSLEQYVALLRRVPARFVIHITRHGFCDRTSHHHWDTETFHHGFEGLLENRQIQSVVDQIAEGDWDENKVKAMLERIGINKQSFQSRRDALKALIDYLDLEKNMNIKSEFADNNAVHGAIDYVPDFYYGSEMGNSIFVLYPAAFIASQYECAHQRFSVPSGFYESPDRRRDDKNDIWVMRKQDTRGVLPLDAGIVFIPANTRVNSRTGSKYKTTSDGFPEKDKPLAEDTVSSQEYWEAYFKAIGYRPSKIIYYDEESPNDALANFREVARLPDDLHSEISLTEIFPENMLGQYRMRDKLSPQREKFRAIAERIISEWFSE